jgi:hypothetical protein
MNFFLFQWNLGYHEALFTDSSFTIESWLSRNLSHELFLFHDGILAIKEPFTRIFLFHDGILAIKEPFTRSFSFSQWNLGYHEALIMNFSF